MQPRLGKQRGVGAEVARAGLCGEADAGGEDSGEELGAPVGEEEEQMDGGEREE